MNPHVVDCLPAGHSLTGCDTVAKVGTKKRLLKTLELCHGLISDLVKMFWMMRPLEMQRSSFFKLFV